MGHRVLWSIDFTNGQTVEVRACSKRKAAAKAIALRGSGDGHVSYCHNLGGHPRDGKKPRSTKYSPQSVRSMRNYEEDFDEYRW